MNKITIIKEDNVDLGGLTQEKIIELAFMKIETFETEIDGLKVHVTNDPEKVGADYLLKNMYECSTVVGNKWAKMNVSKEAFNDKSFHPFIAKYLREYL